MNMDYEERYNKLIEAIKVLQETNPSDVGIQNWVSDNVPELSECEDEDKKIRKEIINIFRGKTCYTSKEDADKYIAWLEKQGEQINLPQFTFGDVLVLERVMETTKEVREDKELYEQLLSLHFKVSTIYEFEKQGKQIHSNSEKVESRWTDDDEETMQNCRGAVAIADYYTMEDKEEMKNWLISLKQRIQVKQ